MDESERKKERKEVDCTVYTKHIRKRKEKKKENLELMVPQLGALVSLPFIPVHPSRARRRSWPLLGSSRFPLCRATASPSAAPPNKDGIGGRQWCLPEKFLCDGLMKRIQSTVAAILIVSQISLPIPTPIPDIAPAEAVLYSPNTKIPRTGEFALRKAIPANPNMKVIQETLEDISYLLRIPNRKPYNSMQSDVNKALKIAKEEKDAILKSMPEDVREKGSLLYASLIDGKGGLQDMINYIKEQDPDKVSVSLASSLETVAEIELLQAPGLSFLLPQQYLNYPRLTGRAIAEFTIERGDGTTFFPTDGGEPQSVAKVQVVVDGYSAPLTAGNFAKLVMDGAYDGLRLKCTSQAVLTDNELEKYGNSVPLELMPSGQFEPLYKTMLSVQDGELPVLPLSVYGAVAMAHNPNSEEYSSNSQFFFYLYDKRNSGLGGLSFDEGQFSVFGYTTGGREVLSQIKTGDIIKSAKLIQGLDRLVLPQES